MAAHDDDMNRGIRPGRGSDDPAGQIAYLEQEIAVLRRKLADSPRHTRILEERIVELQTNLAGVSAQNERLASTLREARDQIVALKEEVDRLAQPPAGFGVFLAANEDGTADIFTGGRKLRVNVSPNVELEDLRRGQEVMLNEALNVVEAMEFERVGEIVTLKEILEDGERALVLGHTDEEKVVRLAEPLLDVTIRAMTPCSWSPAPGTSTRSCPRARSRSSSSRKSPTSATSRSAASATRSRPSATRSSCRTSTRTCSRSTSCGRPRASCSTGPLDAARRSSPRPWRTRWPRRSPRSPVSPPAKSFFLNIKGPELLNKYVGETERQIRLVFQRAREKASEGTPVIVFFDEMESLFRTRGSGVSSDVENTIVPQLLAEIDGVEGLQNVVVIGASNREDMIDPAILRPGRLDVKIKIERPDAEAAKDIFGKYLTERLPLHADDLAEHGGDKAMTVQSMIQTAVEQMYAESEENRFLEVTYANGDKEVLYFKDFNSGAMIENIVGRAKKMAIKDFLEKSQKGLRVSHLLQACVDEFKENEDLPNTTNPDDWARISGKKGERIVYIRTLITGKQGADTGRSIDTVANTGQYL